MQRIVFILVYPFLFFISIMPFKLLYALSDIVFIFMYHIIRYRKQVVTENLKLVFPDKEDSEIKDIRKKFYRHLCDMFLEMIKTITISKNQLHKRFKIKNPEEFKRLEKKNRSIILIFGHYASWEWAIAIQKYINFKGLAVYKKLSNRYFDRLMKKVRSKHNTLLISTKETISKITEYQEIGEKTITGFLSDQSPKLRKEVYWGQFMNMTVPCFTGGERLAKKMNFSVAYLKVNKIKRGYYEAEVVTITETPEAYKDYKITDLFLRMLEEQIKEAPELYFWTHKRWKHRKL